jgi:hypothetical protein
MKIKYVKDELWPVFDIGFEEYTHGEIELDEEFIKRFDDAMEEFFKVQDLFEQKLEEQREDNN